MSLLNELADRHRDNPNPFLIGAHGRLHFDEVHTARTADLSDLRPGDVVAVIGDFDAPDIATILRLIDLKTILAPLTVDTRSDHPYFFENSYVDAVIEGGEITRRFERAETHPLVKELQARGHAGLVLFSSGTTGRQKAILHDFGKFLARYRTPRAALRTLNFLLFDHIGGINTLLHTLFNRGVVVSPSERTPDAILSDIRRFDVELLPTTPTFLRMLLLSGQLQEADLRSLRLVTYGTERMDQGTLDRLCALLPAVDFRQTYGMSELGILRVKSRARDSLWMKVGGEQVETRVVDEVLHIKAENRMLGYLNASQPFAGGWYDTGDLVEQDGDWLKIVGRVKDIINVGGLKILPSEIERVALLHPGCLHARALGVDNPLTGQHIEVTCEPKQGTTLTRTVLREHFRENLPEHFRPHRIRVGSVTVTHRFKQGE